MLNTFPHAKKKKKKWGDIKAADLVWRHQRHPVTAAVWLGLKRNRSNQCRPCGGVLSRTSMKYPDTVTRSHKQFHMESLPLKPAFIAPHLHSSLPPVPSSSVPIHVLFKLRPILLKVRLLSRSPSLPRPPPSLDFSLVYRFIGLLVPLQMPNDKQSKASEPLPCCPRRAAESKQTGYEPKHSHSPPPPAHHKSSYRIYLGT